MIGAISLLFGPLAGPECRRASSRSWLIWLRLLPALAAGSVTFVVLWIWWISGKIHLAHQPHYQLHVALQMIEGMLLAFAMIMPPAVLAGSLAGEKERGSIGLLLTTRVCAADVVLGKLAGRLAQVLMIAMAALPALLLFGSLTGMGPAATLTLVGLPMAVSFGGGGIALAASAISRRGRDALLLVYLLEVLALIGPMIGPPVPGWIGLMSPFEGLDALAWPGEPRSSAMTGALWLGMGLAGLAVASWRLRPTCLAEGDGTGSRKRIRSRRRGWVPPLDDRPMLWKELYIERSGSLGRPGRWVGGLLFLWMGLGSLVLVGIAWWDGNPLADASWSRWATGLLDRWYGRSAPAIGLLIQCAIGLRASVAISSERERGTWDALLTSPMDGGEIVRGKLWGSLYALRWLIGSALLAWTITAAFGGMFAREYVEGLAGLATVGPFMAAAGVRMSLRAATATRAMGMTIGLWLGSYLLAIAAAWTACVVVGGLCLLGWLFAIQAGLVDLASRPWFPMTFRHGSDLVFHALFLIAAIAIAIETRLRFDRLAGRMAGGSAAVAVNRLIHGRPLAPGRREAIGPDNHPGRPELAGRGNG